MNAYSDQVRDELNSAQAIVDAAKGRDLNTDETERVNAHCAKARVLQGKHSAEQRQALAGFGPNEVQPGAKGVGYETASAGYLNPRAKGLGVDIAAAFHQADQYGQKALVPNGVTISETPILNQSPIEVGKPATGLWDLVPTITQTSPTYSYLKQTATTNNAAFVAPGDLKPTSVFGLDKVDGRLRVIAHLSEAIDKFLLEDNANLTTFVNAELVAGLFDALAIQVLTGNGTGENIKGIANTSGIQTQAAIGTDDLTTMRGAITKLENFGVAPRGFAMNAADWASIETARNTSGNFDFGGPIDSATRRAWGVPVAIVPNVPTGTVYAIGEDSVVLRQDGAVRVEWGTPGETFQRNQLVARCETRVNLDVMRPFGIVKVTLPA